MRTFVFAALLGLVLVPPLGAQATRPDEQAEIKKRLSDRLPTLRQLKQAGTVGETAAGFADCVKPGDLDQKVDPKNAASETVRQFLEKENKDRRRAYDLIAARTKETSAEVGKQDGIRRFRTAGPEDWLKTSDDKWVKKKDLEKPK